MSGVRGTLSIAGYLIHELLELGHYREWERCHIGSSVEAIWIV
jgi:hypothetical protein